MYCHGDIRSHIKQIGLACFFVILVAGGLPKTVVGASQIVEAAAHFSASDTLTSYSSGAWGVLGTNVAIYQEPNGLMLVDSETGALQDTLGRPNGYFGAWASFVTPDPSGQSFWVGFTVDDNSDDWIYQVNLQGNWAQKAKLTGNWDLEFHDGNAYVSANPGAATNRIYLLDTTTGTYDVIADVGGYSAGLGIDSVGNIYYGTYNLNQVNDKMYRFSAAQVAAAVGPGSIPLSSAEVLFDIDGGPYDTDVDAVDHLVFNIDKLGSGEKSEIAVWLEGAGENNEDVFYIIADSTVANAWLTMLDVEGDVLAPSGVVRVSAYGYPGLAKISADPIPGDADLDGTVDDLDAAILAYNWQQSSHVTWTHGDFDASGTVDDADATILAANWQQAMTPAPAVPEPSAIMLLAFVPVVSLALHRRSHSRGRLCYKQEKVFRTSEISTCE